MEATKGGNMGRVLQHSFTHGIIACTSFFATGAIFHLMGVPSATGGGAAVIAVVIAGLAAGLLTSARFGWFLSGFLLTAIAWWVVGAIVNGGAAAIMYGTVFVVLATGYGVVAFLVGMGLRFLVTRIKRKTS